MQVYGEEIERDASWLDLFAACGPLAFAAKVLWMIAALFG